MPQDVLSTDQSRFTHDGVCCLAITFCVVSSVIVLAWFAVFLSVDTKYTNNINRVSATL